MSLFSIKGGNISTPVLSGGGKDGKASMPGIGTGMLSVLMVLIMLLLTAFAILSYSTAEAEARLTEKTITAAESYYGADGEAEKILFTIYTLKEGCATTHDLANAVVSAADTGDLPADVTISPDETGDGYTFTFILPADEARQLRLSISILPDAAGAPVLTVRQRKIESTAVWEEEGIYIWDGE